ncbi:hypothetical protein PISL3812_09802 [Talaromyces islandicus]|uniref:Uncharacterized protein n=1 Tax=Talaromyces islandicus TaxID=28573 RepID=A0A0U1MB14_TALIS|nr:hypothetical protein PISL3812_09802 [Talaromyces islandicus]
MATRNRRSHDDYTVGWICALPLEMAAAKAMLDEVHDDLPVQSTDQNTYILGRIKEHDVVIACLPSGDYGLVSANTVAMQLLATFRSIRSQPAILEPENNVQQNKHSCSCKNKSTQPGVADES